MLTQYDDNIEDEFLPGASATSYPVYNSVPELSTFHSVDGALDLTMPRASYEPPVSHTQVPPLGYIPVPVNLTVPSNGGGQDVPGLDGNGLGDTDVNTRYYLNSQFSGGHTPSDL